MDKINQAVAQALRDPEVVKSIKEGGATPVIAKPDQFGRFVHTEVTKWTQAARDVGITAD